MSNNVGTPLFYVGLGLFAFFIAYQLDIASGTNIMVDKALTNAVSQRGGSATKRHKKYRISKSKSLKRE